MKAFGANTGKELGPSQRMAVGGNPVISDLIVCVTKDPNGVEYRVEAD